MAWPMDHNITITIPTDHSTEYPAHRLRKWYTFSLSPKISLDGSKP